MRPAGSAGAQGAHDARPTLAVWKFASCDGCQLSLLDCEDELLALAGAVHIAHFTEMSRATVDGPYDVSLVEGSITTPDDAERIQEIGPTRIDSSPSAPARPPAVFRPCATSPRRAPMSVPSTPIPSTSPRCRPRLRSRPTSSCGLRASGMSHRPPPASRGDHRRARRPQTGHRHAHGLPGMQGQGHRVPARGPRDGVPGSGDPRRVRSPVPAIGRGCFGCFGPSEDGEHRRPGPAPARQRHGARRGVAPVRHLQCGQPGFGTSSPGWPCPDGTGTATADDGGEGDDPRVGNAAHGRR